MYNANIEHTAPRIAASTAIVTWLALVAATIAGWWLAGGAGPDLPATATTPGLVAIVGLAAGKIYLVIAIFMGVRNAPLGWRLLLGGWLLVTAGLVLWFLL